jgi:hypothetical protein
VIDSEQYATAALVDGLAATEPLESTMAYNPIANIAHDRKALGGTPFWWLVRGL